MKGKRVFIEIRLGRGKKTIPALSFGKLAVHKSFAFIDGEADPTYAGDYTITHIPTGYAIKMDIPYFKDARRLVEALSVLDWNFSKREQQGKKFREQVRDIFNQLRFVW